jgi:hypothetical protein
MSGHAQPLEPSRLLPVQAGASDVQSWLSQGLITQEEAKSFSPNQLEFMARKREPGGCRPPAAAVARCYSLLPCVAPCSCGHWF